MCKKNHRRKLSSRTTSPAKELQNDAVMSKRPIPSSSQKKDKNVVEAPPKTVKIKDPSSSTQPYDYEDSSSSSPEPMFFPSFASLFKAEASSLASKQNLELQQPARDNTMIQEVPSSSAPPLPAPRHDASRSTRQNRYFYMVLGALATHARQGGPTEEMILAFCAENFSVTDREALRAIIRWMEEGGTITVSPHGSGYHLGTHTLLTRPIITKGLREVRWVALGFVLSLVFIAFLIVNICLWSSRRFVKEEPK